MSGFLTITVELAPPFDSSPTCEFAEEHEEATAPKMPDASTVVFEYHGPETEPTVETILRSVDGVARVGVMHTSDTSDTGNGVIYWLDDSELVEATPSRKESDPSGDEYYRWNRNGWAMIDRIRDEFDFEIYSHWDYRVDGMAKRYDRYLDEDVTQEMREAGLSVPDESVREKFGPG